MRIFGDWKFVLMLGAAVASVVGPFWLWRADQNAKAISIQLTSQVPLGLTEKNAIPGLQVVIEGVPIPEPVLSTVLVQNSGEKPIATADFEAPLEIRPSAGITIYGARVSERSPVDIDPAIEWDKNTIRIKPTLLNPRDSITLSVVSSGAQPSFSARARIIGISAIEVANTNTKAASPWKRWLLLIAAIVCAVPAMAAIRRIDIFTLDKPTVTLRRRTIYLIVLVLVFAAMGALMGFLSTYGIDGFLPVWLFTMLMLIVASFIGGRLDAIPEQKNDEKAKP